MNKDKIEDVMYHMVLLYRRIEKEGGNGVKEFLKDNKAYKLKAETILGIKKAIIYHDDQFYIKVK